MWWTAYNASPQEVETRSQVECHSRLHTEILQQTKTITQTKVLEKPRARVQSNLLTYGLFIVNWLYNIGHTHFKSFSALTPPPASLCLSKVSLCSPNWPWTPRSSPASAFQLLGLQMCATIPGCCVSGDNRDIRPEFLPLLTVRGIKWSRVGTGCWQCLAPSKC